MTQGGAPMNESMNSDTTGQSGDDVLELLGIPSVQEGEGEVDALMQEKQEMEKRVRSLESELADKDSEIMTLKRDLSQKDVKMGEMEKLLSEIQARPKPAAPSTSGGDYVSGYKAALAQYENRNYEAAIRQFEGLLQTSNTNSYSDNAQYWIGESYYGMGMYQRALLEFEKVFGFVDSNKEDASQLKIGMCYEKLSQNDNAREALQRLLVKYPDSEYVGLAQQILARL